MSTATQNTAPISNQFIPGEHFLETFTLLSPNDQDLTSMGDYIVPVLNQHVSLRHLAAKMPSPLYKNFISLTSFLPSYETCSIKVNPLFHAAIKTIIKSLQHLRLLTPLFFNKRGNNLRNNTQQYSYAKVPLLFFWKDGFGIK